jgi:hypothetical protein
MNDVKIEVRCDPSAEERDLIVNGLVEFNETFATVRLRTHRTKGCGSRIATLTRFLNSLWRPKIIGAASRDSN